MGIWKTIGLLAGLAALFAVLYKSGLMVVKSARALVYIDRRWGRKVIFEACSGKVRRGVRFRQTKTYRITLKTELTAGTVRVELLDREKQALLTLTPESPDGQVLLVRGARYTLVHTYSGASGKLELEYE